MADATRNLNIELTVRTDKLKQGLNDALNSVRTSTEQMTGAVGKSTGQVADLIRKMNSDVDRLTLSSTDYRISQIKREAESRSEAIQKMGLASAEMEKLMVANAEAAAIQISAIYAKQAESALTAMKAVKAYAADFGMGLAAPVAGMFAAGAVAEGLFGLGKGMIDANREAENLTIGLATTISTTTKFVDSQGHAANAAESFALSQKKANAMLRDFNMAAIQTQMSGEQLAKLGESLAPIYDSMGGKDLVGFTTRVAQAAGVFNLGPEQISKDVRDMLEGRGRMTALAGPLMGLADNQSQYNLAMKGGPEGMEVLEQMLGKLKVAADAHKSSWDGLVSTLQTADTMFLKLAGEEAFNAIKSDLGDLGDKVFVTQNGVKDLNPEIKAFAHNVGILADALAHLAIAGGKGFNMLMMGFQSDPKRMGSFVNAKAGGYGANGQFVLPGDLHPTPARPTPLNPDYHPATYHQVARHFGPTAGEYQREFNTYESRNRLGTLSLEGEKSALEKMLGEMGTAQEGTPLYKRIASRVDAIDKALERHQKATERMAAKAETLADKYSDQLTSVFEDHPGSGNALNRLSLADGFAKPKYLDAQLKDAFATNLGDLTGLVGPASDSSNSWSPESDKLLKNIIAYQRWKGDESKKWEKTFSQYLNFGVTAATDVIQARSGASGGESLRTWGGLAAMGVGLIPGAQPVAAGIGAVTSIGAAMMDQNDKNNDILAMAATGKMVNRSDLADAAANKGMGPLGWVGRGLADFVSLGSAESGFRKQAAKALAAYDDKFAGRFDHTMEGGAKGQYDQAMDALGDFAQSLRDNKVPEDEINREVDARQRVIDANYKAAQAAEVMGTALAEVSKVAKDFQGITNIDAIRQKLTGRTDTVSDYINLVAGSQDTGGRGIYSGRVDATRDFLGNGQAMNQALGLFEQMTMAGNNVGDEAASAGKLADLIGRGDLSDAIAHWNDSSSASNYGDAKTAIQSLTDLMNSVLLPAMSHLADMGVGNAINIGQLGQQGSQQNLNFTAPTMMQPTYNYYNTWNIGGNIIGADRNGMQELARQLGVMQSNQTSQTA